MVMLIMERRPADEYEKLIALMDDLVDCMDVKEMAQFIIECYKEEAETLGRKQGETEAKRANIIKLLEIKFVTIPDVVAERVNSIEDFACLDALFEKAATIDLLDEFLSYLVLFILNERSVDEHKELLTLLDIHAHDMQAKKIVKLMVDVLMDQGKLRTKREDIIKLLHIRFDDVPEVVTQKVKRIRSLSRLNSLFEKAATIDSLDDFDA
ncbi:hypothetical protein F4X73_12785 [Candidatus Poribacteria bacterium]|nr:hypothetical protein [Candidatus Poribacteria bacterium]MYB65559.1 hypothetical protein [Candidatus Poribacteria bacterium]